MKKNIRKHDRVYMNIRSVSMSAVMAIITTINEQGYSASINDLHEYDTNTSRYSFDIELHLTSQFGVYGHSTDWSRMRKVCAMVYTIVKNDLLMRRYSNAAIGLSFYRDADDAMIHYYTDFTVDYSIGNDDGIVRFVRLR